MLNWFTRLFSKKPDPDRQGVWYLVYWDEYGWGACMSAVKLGEGPRSQFASELARIGGRHMLTSRNYLAGGTYDFEITERTQLVERGWDLKD